MYFLIRTWLILAGSERPSVIGTKGIRLKEGGFINKSLFALGNVINIINKLSEEERYIILRDNASMHACVLTFVSHRKRPCMSLNP